MSLYVGLNNPAVWSLTGGQSQSSVSSLCFSCSGHFVNSNALLSACHDKDFFLFVVFHGLKKSSSFLCKGRGQMLYGSVLKPLQTFVLSVCCFAGCRFSQ